MKISLSSRPLFTAFQLLIIALTSLSCTSLFAEEKPEKNSSDETIIKVKPGTKVPESLKKRPWEKIKISKETTFFTEPVHEDGTIDYLNAINQLNKPKGLTPKNNGAALLVTVLRKEISSEVFYENLLKELELKKGAIKGPFLVNLNEAIKKENKAKREMKPGADEPVANESGADESNLAESISRPEHSLDKLMSRSQSAPWTSNEHPILAKWISENEKPLEIVEEALACPHFYLPYVTSRKGNQREILFATILPIPQQYRSVARVLKARAMMHIGEGHSLKAKKDLITIHKLARKIGSQHNTLIEQLISIAIENIALEGDRIVSLQGNLSIDQLNDYRNDLKKLGRVSNIQEAILIFERVGALDAISHLSRKGENNDLESLLGTGVHFNAFQRIFDTLTIDWNQVMKNINAWYDQYDNTDRKSFSEIQKEMKAIELKMQETKAILGDPTTAVKSVFWGRNYRSQVFSDVLLSLLAPAIGRCYYAQERSKMEMELTQITLALAAWNKENKEWPKSLKQLVPKYLLSIPNDRFNDQDLKYTSDGKTFLLYSVGDDRKDNGGKSDRNVNNERDIIVTSPK